MSSESEYSETQDVEETTAHCDATIIPIFPLRFALTGTALIDMLSASSTPTTPQNISAMPNHELLRIRQGYFYVYDGNVFQIFWFNTSIADENGSIYRDDTEKGGTLAYSFTKYHFEDGTPQGEWTLLENEMYPYAFAPKDTPKVWVAYSEERWPNQFFGEIPDDTTLRDLVMTEVDLTSRSGPFCAPISELASRVNTFTTGEIEYSEVDYTLENAIRHTAVEIEDVSKVVTCNNTREKGVLVAVHDPVGELQDLLGLMSVHAMTLTNFAEEHQYPLMMGRAVKNYATSGEVGTKTVNWLWEGWGNTGELSRQFDTKYTELLTEMERLENTQKRLTQHWMNIYTQTGVGTASAIFDACTIITNRYSLARNPIDHSDALAYMLTIQARAMAVSAMSSCVAKALSALFTEVVTDATPSGSDNAIRYVKLAVDLSKEAVSLRQKLHPQFNGALNAMFTVYGTQIVEAGVNSPGSSTHTLLREIFARQPVSFHDASELQNVFSDMMQNVGWDNADIDFTVHTAGNNVSATMLLSEAADGQVGVIEFRAQVDLTLEPERLAHARTANNFEFGTNGFGLVAAGLSLHQTIANWNNTPQAYSAIGQFAQNPVTQLIAGFAGAYEASIGLASAAIGRSNGAATQTVLRRVFGNNARLVNAAAANGGSSIVRISPGAIKTLNATAKAAGVVGVVMSGFMAVEGYQRGDKAMMLGNGLMAAGGLVLLFVATGPLAVIAVVAIIIGLVVSFFSLNDVQLWVQHGFWGTSGEYWRIKRYDSIDDQINAAKILANPSDSQYQSIKDEFELELAEYIDINASLTVTDLQANDGKVEVSCALLQSESDLSRLRVSAEYDKAWTVYDLALSVNTQFIASGKAQLIIAKPNSITDARDVDIEVEVSRIRDNTFEESLTIRSDRLW
ncbi:toxin VasX [Ningiella sp. W23]|uniref:toxin VasX n=1 Tax=Ningiella sp. W23 TaxID=3023715 RepID=UPI0037563E5D